MRRILDIDKLQENRGKRQRRIKNDLARRKQYALKRKEKEARTLNMKSTSCCFRMMPEE